MVKVNTSTLQKILLITYGTDNCHKTKYFIISKAEIFTWSISPKK